MSYGRSWTLSMGARRVSRLVVTDLHNFDREQDPDPLIKFMFHCSHLLSNPVA
jgi:hypothetical protein